MTKKQLMNRMSVTCWEFYKKYHDMVPLDEHEVQMMAEEATQIVDQYNDTISVKGILNAYCKELCEEKEED